MEMIFYRRPEIGALANEFPVRLQWLPMPFLKRVEEATGEFIWQHISALQKQK
jgi:hypothetical protein